MGKFGFHDKTLKTKTHKVGGLVQKCNLFKVHYRPKYKTLFQNWERKKFQMKDFFLFIVTIWIT